jgi:Ca-activated chloride channel family protein
MTALLTVAVTLPGGEVLLEPLWLLAVAPVLAAWFLRHRRRGTVVGMAPLAVVEGGRPGPLPTSLRARWRALPSGLEMLGFLAAVVALARPALPVSAPPRAAGIDIVLGLDVSSSMGGRDLDPARTRLDLARDAALAFIAGRPHDRVGLVAFARYPDLLAPPTLDHEALRAFLGAVRLVEGDGAEDATGIGTAIARAVATLAAGPPRPGDAGRVAILLTDGEENVAREGAKEEIAPLHAAQLARERGVRVHLIAVGPPRPAGAAPDGGGEGLAALVRAVQSTGGEAHRAADAAALAAVYERIDDLERVPAPSAAVHHAPAHLGWLVACLVLVALGRLLRARVAAVWP